MLQDIVDLHDRKYVVPIIRIYNDSLILEHLGGRKKLITQDNSKLHNISKTQRGIINRIEKSQRIDKQVQIRRNEDKIFGPGGVKRKITKGPNPLSVKNKSVHNSEGIDIEDDCSIKRKRTKSDEINNLDKNYL
jgi:hypothetical protein